MSYIDELRQILRSPTFSTCRLAAWLPAVQDSFDVGEIIENCFIDGEEPPALFLDAVEHQAAWDGADYLPYELVGPDDLQ